MERPRRAVAMSGGGAKGSFQVGALEWLILEKGLDFDIFSGVSVGALNASFLAQAKAVEGDAKKSLENLQEMFKALRDVWLKRIEGNSSIYEKRTGGLAGVLAGADSIHDSQPLRDLLGELLNPKALENSGRDLRIQYVSLETGVIHAVDQNDPNIIDHVLASSSMPFLFPPVEERDRKSTRLNSSHSRASRMPSSA